MKGILTKEPSALIQAVQLLLNLIYLYYGFYSTFILMYWNISNHFIVGYRQGSQVWRQITESEMHLLKTLTKLCQLCSASFPDSSLQVSCILLESSSPYE